MFELDLMRTGSLTGSPTSWGDRMNGSFKKILVVEDSPFLGQMYDLLFMESVHKGMEVIHARDGVEALAKLEEAPDCDLILLDLIMPRMDGITFMEHLRERENKRPVIVVSSNTSREDKEKALALGARGYLVKPITPAALFGLIESLSAPEPESDGVPRKAQSQHDTAS